MDSASSLLGKLSESLAFASSRTILRMSSCRTKPPRLGRRRGHQGCTYVFVLYAIHRHEGAMCVIRGIFEYQQFCPLIFRLVMI